MYYYGARYYDPRLARFVSADTIVPKPFYPQSLNRFAYTYNNPIRFIDLDGHEATAGEDEGGFAGIEDDEEESAFGKYAREAAQENYGHWFDAFNGKADWTDAGFIAADIATLGRGKFATSVISKSIKSVKGVKAGKASKATGFKKDKTFYRSMSKKEADIVLHEKKPLRGGRPGETHFTDSRYKSADKAKDRLSLPNRPEVQMEFTIKNDPTPSRKGNGTRVEPKFGGRGAGKEFKTKDPVEVNIINIQPY